MNTKIIHFPETGRRRCHQKERLKDGLVKRGKYYHYVKNVNGKVVWRSTKQETRDLAKIWVEQNITLPEREKKLGIRPRPEINFIEFVDKFLLPHVKVNQKLLTYCYYKSKLVPLKEFFGRLNISDITPELVEQYKIKRISDRKMGFYKKEETLKGASVNREINVLSALCKLAIRLGYLRINPVAGIKRFREEPPQAKILFEEDFVNKFLPAANPKGFYGITELYTLVFYLGLRNGEVRNLKWGDIDFRNKILSIWDTKTNTPRHIPLNDFLTNMLKELKKEAPSSEYVFVNRRGQKLQYINKGFKETLRRAGLTLMRFHDLRHSFVSNCAEKGHTWEKTSAITGHKSYEMYKRYQHLFDHSAREVINSFSAPKTFISSREKKLFINKNKQPVDHLTVS